MERKIELITNSEKIAFVWSDTDEIIKEWKQEDLINDPDGFANAMTAITLFRRSEKELVDYLGLNKPQEYIVVVNVYVTTFKDVETIGKAIKKGIIKEFDSPTYQVCTPDNVQVGVVEVEEVDKV